jgi:hypothetical protein
MNPAAQRASYTVERPDRFRDLDKLGDTKMKKLMIALTLTAAGLMAAQSGSTATPAAGTSTTAPTTKTTKVKKHHKNVKSTTPAAAASTAPTK